MKAYYLAGQVTGIYPRNRDAIGSMYNAIYRHDPKHLEDGRPWALDNGAFSDRFDIDEWVKGLRKYADFVDTCRFAVIPDVVGDAAQTFDLFYRYYQTARAYGYPIAYAAQDGEHPANVPWKMIDYLFIGGSTEWKKGKNAGKLISKALYYREVPVHIGRVNSTKRIRRFWSAQSWDGNNIGFDPQNQDRLASAVREVRAMQNTRGLL